MSVFVGRMGPYRKFFSLTSENDGASYHYQYPTDAIYVGTGGTVNFLSEAGDLVESMYLTSGAFHPISAYWVEIPETEGAADDVVLCWSYKWE